MKTLEGLELVGDTGGEGADSDVTDIAEEVLDADLLGLFGFDNGGSVNEGLGSRSSVLLVYVYQSVVEAKRLCLGGVMDSHP